VNPQAEQRFSQLQDGVQQLCVYRDLLKRRIETLREEEEKLKYRADLHQKCAEVIKAWLEDSLQSNVDSIADLATSGLQHIITDQTLAFQIQQEQKYNRVAMRFVVDDNGVTGDPMDSFGGGAVSIISLVMRLAVMARMKMGNLLLLDESMGALANKYVPGAASFMRQLADQTGINILMVTHNDEFIDHAHLSYEGEKIVKGPENEELRIRVHGVK
jgi:DNA repair exonuclease SbcCD ATPase subunit